MKRKILTALLVLVFCLSLAVSALAAPGQGFIVDEFGVLTDSEIAQLNTLAQGIYERCGVGIFFVYTNTENLSEYNIGQLVGSMEDYFVMMENDSSWYTFKSGRGELIDETMEGALRTVYDQEDTYYGGVEEFLYAAEMCIPASSDPTEPTDGNTAPGVASDADALVFDDAGLLSDTEEQALSEKLLDISQEYQAQIVVATISSMDDGDIDGFVEYLYDAMGFGYGENHDGVLLLVCMDPREYRILSNGMAADAISSSDIDTISDAIVSDLSDGDYVGAFDEFADQCAYYLDGHINGFPFNFGKSLIIALVIGILAGVIVAFVLKGQLKSVRKQNQANVYVKPGSMQVTVLNDFFLYRDVTRTKKESSNSSGSGSSRNTGGGSF